ncbi:MAG: recombinase family protein [Patescibacteria group bacterium]
MDIQTPVSYCLYARKSSESDERQAMSIDSQIKEMTDLLERDGLIVKEIYRESHSAKESGARPVFAQLITDIKSGKFNGILTWAPDRLSRNAGDLGMLVDLMDQGKLVQIKTFSQSFSNTPNEKFLLMILCSQAKLENDQKGLNVKRGIRAKCEMGWRPGPPPIGYFNRSFNGLKDIVVDPERGHIVTAMFRKASEGEGGRKIKIWLDGIGFTSRSGKKVTLSMIYLMLNNPFYYGEFEYPRKSGKWYKGSYPPLITKEIFDKVREQLVVPVKSKWGAKFFTYKGIFKCGTCKSSVVGEERFRKRKVGEPRKHIYYHCSRYVDYKCPEGFITEGKLEKQLLRFINFIYIAHPDEFILTEKIQSGIEKFKKLRDEILFQQNINPNTRHWDIRDFSKYALTYGLPEDKRELFNMFKYELFIKNEMITTLRGH